MKRVAEDSHKVALLTRRDSADMRIIAGVTLIFLPGTFTAVRLIIISLGKVSTKLLLDDVQLKLF